jgi:hypothetical protein
MIPADTISLSNVVTHVVCQTSGDGSRSYIAVEHDGDRTVQIVKTEIDTIVCDQYYLLVKLYDGTFIVEELMDGDSEWEERVARMAEWCGLFPMSRDHMNLMNVGWGVVGYQ